jgi:hypothetical protein
MIKAIVHHNQYQGCWYIKEVWDEGESDGVTCYKSRERAVEVARRKYPYVCNATFITENSD